MPDISKCTGHGCAVKEFCWRYTSPCSSPCRQSWLGHVPGDDEYCEWYWPDGEGAPDPKISAVNLKALQILRGSPGITAKRFAKAMWPESEGWKRPAKCGPKGSHRGGGMYLAAGGFLGRLKKLGFVTRTLMEHPTLYQLTRKGMRALHYTLEKRQGDG